MLRRTAYQSVIISSLEEKNMNFLGISIVIAFFLSVAIGYLSANSKYASKSHDVKKKVKTERLASGLECGLGIPTVFLGFFLLFVLSSYFGLKCLELFPNQLQCNLLKSWVFNLTKVWALNGTVLQVIGAP